MPSEPLLQVNQRDPVRLVRRHGGAECPAADNVRKALATIAEATVA